MAHKRIFWLFAFVLLLGGVAGAITADFVEAAVEADLGIGATTTYLDFTNSTTGNAREGLTISQSASGDNWGFPDTSNTAMMVNANSLDDKFNTASDFEITITGLAADTGYGVYYCVKGRPGSPTLGDFSWGYDSDGAAIHDVSTISGQLGAVQLAGDSDDYMYAVPLPDVFTSDGSGTLQMWVGCAVLYNTTDNELVRTQLDGVVIIPSPEHAWNPSPAVGSISAVDTDLSWSAGANAISHDVYFGTSESAVANAQRLAGDIDGDGSVDITDLSVLGTQWLIDPGSTIPSADIEFSGIVDLGDFTTVAADWGLSADAEFMGTQTGTTYDPGILVHATTYYWRIDEVQAGNTVAGSEWNFKTPDVLKKGPYLIYPGNNTQMTVLWQLEDTQSATLEWGTDTSYSTGSTVTTEYGTDHQHKYTITGLTPATKYYYRVTVLGNSSTGTFYSGAESSATAVKFLAYGDTRNYPADHDVVCGGIVNAFTIDPGYQTFTLHVGDFNGNCLLDSDWQDQFFDRTYPNTPEMQANLPINGCAGNHEWCGYATYYQKYYPYPYVNGMYWSFDYGPAHIVVLDQYSASYSTGSTQYNWLVNDLNNSTKEWKFILLHEPGYSAGGHGNSSSVQNYIQPLCETYGVDIVFAGHNHYYARCDRNGVKHITTGGGGAPLYSPDPGYPYLEAYSENYHYCTIDIDGTMLNFEAIKPDGTVIDSFTLSH